jgi:hypothetical protein
MGLITPDPLGARQGSNSASVKVVVTCASRKRLPIPDRLRLGAIRHAETPARARAWIERLRTDPSEARPARQMYAGDHWRTAMSIETEAPDCSIAIVSAGYGLIGADTAVKPYSATFSPGPDSVSGDGDTDHAGQEWWNQLTQEPPSSGSGPRSLQELAVRMPHDTLLVALSGPYLRAVEQDLVMAAECLTHPSQLIVISAGTKAAKWIDGTIQTSAEWQGALGGSRLSLNVRIARHLVRRRFDHGWDRAEIARLLSKCPPSVAAPSHSRTRMTDDEVVAFIQAARESEPSLSKSGLLRRLREAGQACEQVRFGNLFHATALQ